VGGWALVAIATVVIAYAALSGWLVRTPITAALFFVAAGLLIGDEAFGLVDAGASSELVRRLAEATLALVLFSDASRIDVRALRREFSVPGRLLGIGLPLTIAAGTLAAFLIDGLSLAEGLVLAVALAPTDAALGQAVVTDERLPTRVRQSLNVESGLNDGICVPLLFVALAIAEVDEGETGSGGAVEILLEEIGWGAVGGIVAGVLAALVVRHAVSRGLASAGWLQVIPVAAAALAYGLASGLGGSGFIAAFVGGLVFAALRRPAEGELSYFIEEAGGLLDAVTFVVFGAIFLGPVLGRVEWEVVAYALLSLTVVRMLPVAVSLLGSGAAAPTVAFVGWFGPRGLASIVFAVIILDEADLASESTLLDTIFFTVGLSVLLHGLSAVPLTNRYVRWYERRPRPAMEGQPSTEVRWRRSALPEKDDGPDR
jgi:NhaP-type Na+/H+ or K+/H+ antiporter